MHKLKDIIAATLLVLLGTWLRAGLPGVTEFKYDEAAISLLALDIATGKQFHLLGLGTSTGFPNTPIGVYLFAIPYLFDHTPVLATIFVGLLNVLAVALCWRLTRRHFGFRIALMTTFLYVVAPWTAVFTRKLWVNYILAPFVLGVVVTGLEGFRKGRKSSQATHVVLLSVLVLLHPSGIFMIPVSLTMLWLWRHQIDKRAVGIGFGLAVLPAIPFLVGLGMLASGSSGLPLPDLTRGVSEGSGEMRFDSLNNLLLIVSGMEIHSLAGPEKFREYLASLPDLWALLWVLPIGMIAGLVVLVIDALTERKTIEQGLLIMVLVWFLTPLAATLTAGASGVPFFPHDIIPILPTPFLIISLGFDRLDRELKQRVARQALSLGLTALLIVIGAFQVAATRAIFNYVATESTPNGFGTPLEVLLNIRNSVLVKNPGDIVVISSGDQSVRDNGAVWHLLFYDTPSVRVIDGRSSFVQPAGSAELLIDPDPAIRSGPYGPFLLRDDADRLARRAGESPLVNLTLQPLPFSTATPWLIPAGPLTYSNGVAFNGLLPGDTFTSIRLTLPAPVSRSPFISLQVINNQGERIAQVDSPLWSGHNWREGDTLLSWLRLDISEDAIAVNVILYTFNLDGSTQSIDVLDETGAAYSPWITVPLR